MRGFLYGTLVQDHEGEEEGSHEKEHPEEGWGYQQSSSHRAACAHKQQLECLVHGDCSHGRP